MTAVPSPADVDSSPPVPPGDYARIVAGVNVGYDLVFTLASCFLRALHRPDLNLLVVGAGGGMEIERFLPTNPGWRIVGVDPSGEMLALTRSRAEQLGVRDRAELVYGTVDDLSTERRFDAAVCLNVLHFLPEDANLTLLRGIAARLRGNAPLLVGGGARVDGEDLRDDYLGAWQQHGEMMGLPAEQMAAIIREVVERQAGMSTADEYLRLLREAGFQQVAPFLNVMNGGMVFWIARPHDSRA